MNPSVLIVEDEAILSDTMREYLARHGFEAAVADSGEAALERLGEAEPDLLLLDYRLPGLDGLALLQQVKQSWPAIEVVMLTAHGTARTAVDAMRAGAFDYLAKPIDLEELVVVLEKAWAQVRLRRELRYFHETARQGRGRLVGDSDAMQRVRSVVGRLATLERASGGAPAVLITGETGTGKGLVARLLHELSPRADRPFVEINCAALPATLLEAELFGYERGAFTDARASKPGLFEAADRGMLFLDEIGTMSLDVQAKLLTAIEEKAVRRLGALRSRVVDTRIIAATNADLDEAARAGTFRPDLIYRLRVLTIELPPLRRRPDDILPLARHHVAAFCRKYGQVPKRLMPDAEALLRSHPWPGNVRELANVLERVVLLHDGDTVHAADLGLAPRPHTGVLHADPSAIHVDFTQGPVSLAQVEQTMIAEALRAANGNRRRAAELLDISPETLRYRLEKHGLLPDARPPRARLAG